MLLKLLRQGLGRLIILISFFIPIKKQQRSAEEQKCADELCSSLSLYQFYACPFCLKARRAIKQLNLKIETRDALINPYRAELLAGGGEIKVPCLRIDKDGETQWMYESSEIISYLQQRFAEDSSLCNQTS